MKSLNEIDLNKLSSQEKHELIIKKCEEIDLLFKQIKEYYGITWETNHEN